jgi:hypothetical protein
MLGNGGWDHAKKRKKKTMYIKIKDENPSQKYKANESTSRHSQSKKNKSNQSMKNKETKTLCK